MPSSATHLISLALFAQICQQVGQFDGVIRWQEITPQTQECQVGEIADFRRQRCELVAFQGKPSQVGEIADFRRQRCELVLVQVKPCLAVRLARLPISGGSAMSWFSFR